METIFSHAHSTVHLNVAKRVLMKFPSTSGENPWAFFDLPLAGSCSQAVDIKHALGWQDPAVPVLFQPFQIVPRHHSLSWLHWSLESLWSSIIVYALRNWSQHEWTLPRHENWLDMFAAMVRHVVGTTIFSFTKRPWPGVTLFRSSIRSCQKLLHRSCR